MKAEVLTEEIAALERRLAEAEQAGNSVALHRLIAPDFDGIDSHGRRVDREGFVRAFITPELLIEALHLEKLSVRVFEDAAMAIGSSEARGTALGGPFHGRYHFTDVWVRRAVRWELVAAHISAAAT